MSGLATQLELPLNSLFSSPVISRSAQEALPTDTNCSDPRTSLRRKPHLDAGAELACPGSPPFFLPSSPLPPLERFGMDAISCPSSSAPLPLFPIRLCII